MNTVGSANSIQNRFWLNVEQELGFQHFNYHRQVHYPSRLQDEYVVVYCLRGEVEVTEFGETELLREGEILIGNSLQPRSSRYGTSLPCEGLTLIAAPKLVAELARFPSTSKLPSKLPVYRGKRDGSRLRHLAEDVIDELKENRMGKSELLDALGRELLVRVLRLWPQVTGAQSALPSRLLSRRHFVGALDYMHSRGKSDFSVDGMCVELRLDPGDFAKLFRSSTGLSPLQVYNRLLIDRATNALQHDAESVKDVAYRLGFQSPSHFTSLYRKVTGVLPSDARQMR